MPAAFDSHNLLRSIAALYRADEATCLENLFPAARLNPAQRPAASALASRWISDIRHNHRPGGSITDLLGTFGLTSQEGLALMCLAEALLRIPDRATADALIRDKLNETDWNGVIGENAPWAVNVSGWALSLTGKIIQLEDPTKHSPGAALGKLISRLGQPIIREAIKSAMQWLADQFVMGETIERALDRAKPAMAKGVRYSFDMLGEGARTAEDAERYYQLYVHAVDALAAFQATHKFERVSGISVKLSALHPRYEMAQRERVMREMAPRLVALCEQAMRAGIPLTIDAEEADRLQLSLEVAAELLAQAKLGDWQGLGFAVQAYQKRAPAVIDYFVALARHHDRKLGIRLVKGAYWDSEIKRAQERGWDDFPVYTRKAGTDASYLACARRMLDAPDAINAVFGTHNAMTAAHLVELAGDPKRLEFQHLHGMGEELFDLLHAEGFATCVYAPVGNHDVLLGYLVRRILENGANSSFVHRVLDRNVPVADLTIDPVDDLKSRGDLRHPKILRAPDLYGANLIGRHGRKNSTGLDLADPFVTEPLLSEIAQIKPRSFTSTSIVDGQSISFVDAQLIDQTFQHARTGYAEWSRKPVDVRAACLEKLGDLLEQNRAELMALLIREGGKTLPDALGEIREAVDFCRYYALRAREDFKPIDFPGPTGESNRMHLTGRGVFVCISPWNFPLAIFLGQATAALVAGNSVIAKPAPQTPMIAVAATRLIHAAGIPENVFHLVNGGPDIGAMLVQHPYVAGVAFTGSTATGRAINQTLAHKDGPIVPLIAETGGQNALIVDSSALAEQVVDDVIASSFRSAGQRCSALRILCLPTVTADKILAMLKGAMRELRVGDPGKLETDIGHVIDKAAQQRLQAHIDRLKDEAKEIATVSMPATCLQGAYIAPQAWEIPNIDWLNGEVFGPILHVVRYDPARLGDLIEQINATGFGLTGGVHSRIESTVQQVEQNLRVGNFYVNRSLIGAVVGVQPFGGEGLSGTGPKAGGPHYLPRFALERVTSNNLTAAGGNASLLIASS
jgi:RHH-type proline utilization regulon transcriptional repressor/proline dehydrogenase/delta 1-pyrroline-5-carboxylate dehydrogenase